MPSTRWTGALTEYHDYNVSVAQKNIHSPKWGARNSLPTKTVLQVHGADRMGVRGEENYHQDSSQYNRRA